MRYKPRIPRTVPDLAAEPDGRKHPKHLVWIKKQRCLLDNGGPCHCGGAVDAHHVRNGTDGGTGLKPHDRWCVPLCRQHHDQLHREGWRSFERLYNVNLRSEALSLAKRSPDRGVRE